MYVKKVQFKTVKPVNVKAECVNNNYHEPHDVLHTIQKSGH